MALGWQQILIVLILAVVLFGGRGRISSIMGDMANGIKSFRKGLAEDEAEAKSEEAAQTASLDQKPTDTVETPEKEAAKSE
ncbi:MAG: twin-arginine translocase TatA/TatE family subunit [Pseudomonadota bacterium]